MSNKKLGIYFGKDKIAITEADGKRIISSVSLPLAATAGQQQVGVVEAAPDEIKQVALIQSAIRDNKIEAKSAFVGVSNKDLFIRGFQMPFLNKPEMSYGVPFEAKKYLPLRIEDLVFDYQYRGNKKTSKMDILFTATTKINFDKYLAILNQVGVQIKSIEPASFSLLRILSLIRQFNVKSSFALVVVEDSDVEFSIIDKGFPCFSRDIKLSQSKNIPPISVSESNIQSRLASELRISMDYFRRQFSGTSVDRVLLINKNTAEDLAPGLSKELGLEVKSADFSKEKSISSLSDLDILKSYSLVLKDSIKVNLAIDLTVKKTAPEGVPEEKLFAFDIKLIQLPLAISFGILALSYGFPLLEINKLNAKLRAVAAETANSLGPSLSSLSIDELRNKRTEYAQRLADLENLTNARIYITPSWDALPNLLTKGLWFEEYSLTIKDNHKNLRIKGAVYLGDENVEVNAVNDFIKSLKENSDFMQGLNVLDVVSINRSQVGEYQVTAFEISGG